jgi:hypothetical protein
MAIIWGGRECGWLLSAVQTADIQPDGQGGECSPADDAAASSSYLFIYNYATRNETLMILRKSKRSCHGGHTMLMDRLYC